MASGRESPLLDRFLRPLVHRKQWNGGPVESWKSIAGETIGSLVFADKGRLILAVDHGLHLFDTRTGTTRFFADPKGARMDLAYNDGKVDRAGRYWVGHLRADRERAAWHLLSRGGRWDGNGGRPRFCRSAMARLSRPTIASYISVTRSAAASSRMSSTVTARSPAGRCSSPFQK